MPKGVAEKEKPQKPKKNDGVTKVTIAHACRDVVIYVLENGKLWQFLVITVCVWLFFNVKLQDAKMAAHFLLHAGWFAWGGWAICIIAIVLSAAYIKHVRKKYSERIQKT